MADFSVYVAGTQWTSDKKLEVKDNWYRRSSKDSVAWLSVDLVERVLMGDFEGGLRITDSIAIYASLFELEQFAKDIISGVAAARENLKKLENDPSEKADL